MRLATLLRSVDVVGLRGDPDAVDVDAVTHDSSAAAPGVVFCCVVGGRADGHDFAEAAVRAGSPAIVCERLLPLDVVQVQVERTRAAMGPLASAVHGEPSRALTVIGVTGTNGKTTTTHLLQAVLEANGMPTEVLGTMSGTRTTPEAPELQASLAQARDAGKLAVAMEVSSPALVQHRVDGTDFAAAVFTNLGHDHLEVHGTIEAYFQAKSLLFRPELAQVGVVNADDPYGRRLIDAGPIPMHPWSIDDASDVELEPAESRFRWRGQPVRLRLGGRFNVANALAAATTASALGLPEATIAEGLSALDAVRGHVEPLDAGQPFTVVIDYAHTPDALEAVLAAARDTAPATARIIVVFGCGGDRDPSKRPLMGRAASRLADMAVVTSDNPRSEDPAAIIDAVTRGMDGGAQLVIEPDRAAAIGTGLAAAGPGDVVIIAGKGHETGQEVAGVTHPFDDREVAARLLAEQGHG